MAASGVGQEYLQRLADIDAAVARARLDPVVVVERVAGLLAGRVGCRVDDAHAFLLRRASEQGRAVVYMAGDVLATVESRVVDPRRWDSALDELTRPSPRPVRWRGRPGAVDRGVRWGVGADDAAGPWRAADAPGGEP